MRTPLQSLLLVALLTFATGAHALEVRNARTPQPPAGSPVMAGYMELYNYADEAVTVSGASSPVFDRVEIHQTIVEDGSVRMERIHQLEIAPASEVHLVPRGRHLMLFTPSEEVEVGDKLPVQLETTEGTIDLELTVKDAIMFDHDDAEHAE